jgi:hypothetical protein
MFPFLVKVRQYIEYNQGDKECDRNPFKGGMDLNNGG